jgi:hypothetical protein
MSKKLDGLLNKVTMEYILFSWVGKTPNTSRIFKVLKSYHINTMYEALQVPITKITNLRNLGVKNLSLTLCALDDYLTKEHSITLEEYEQSLNKKNGITKDNLILYGIGEHYQVQENWKYERIKNLNKMFL